MIGGYAAEDNVTGGGLVEDEPPQNNAAFSIAYGFMEDNKLNSRIQYNEYIHIKDATAIMAAGNWCVWKPDRGLKVENHPPILRIRAETSERAKRLAEHFGAEVRFSTKLRSSTTPAISRKNTERAMHLAAPADCLANLHANPVPATLQKMAGAGTVAAQDRARAPLTAEIIDVTAEPVPADHAHNETPGDDEPTDW